MCKAVAGCDLSDEKLEEAKDNAPGIFLTKDYDEMLAREDVHIVAIYTPDHLHAEQIQKAFRAGKHVICTKPLVNNPDVAPKLFEEAKAHGTRLQVAQSTRFFEPFQRQREQFESGKFGEIEVVDAHYNHRMDWYYEKSPWSVSETEWIYLGASHPVDYARWYLGEIAEVHAYGTITNLGSKYGLSKPDAMVINLKGKNGRIGRVLANYGFHELPQARSLIEGHLMGSEGSSLARYPDLRYTYHDENGVEIIEDFHHSMSGYYFRHQLKGMHYGEFCNIADYFASCIHEEKPNSPDLEEGLQTVLVMGAISKSMAEGGKVVEVPKLGPHV
jgi:predicted dehydrogenase